MIDTERKEDLFLDTKLIKSENRLNKLRIIDKLHPVVGDQPTHEKDQPNDNNPVLDLACTMKFTIDKADAIDKKADTKLAKAQNLKDVANVAIARDNLGLGTSATMNATSTLSDRTDQTATIKAVNDVNRAASTAQKTANTANDKANTAQTRADSAYSLAGKKWDIINNTGYAPGKDIDDFIAGEGGYIRPPVNGNIPRTGLDVITKSQYGSSDLLQIAFPQRTSLEFHMRTKSADGWSRWFEFYHTANTTTDKSGFLRASGSKDAVTTDQITSTLSDRTDRVASIKVVNDVNRSAVTAQKTANNAHALAQKKQDKLEFVGDGSEVMKTGAFGLGGYRNGEEGYTQVPMPSEIYNTGRQSLTAVMESASVEESHTPRQGQLYGGIAIPRALRPCEIGVSGRGRHARLHYRGFQDATSSVDDWHDAYGTSNTTTDKSGFLRASGSKDAVTTDQITSTLSDRTDRVASIKAVNDVNNRINDVPVDQIFVFESTTPPKGYIARNGQAINKNTMPKLYARYGANMPDDRNRYHRMQGSLTGGVGSTHEDAIRNITGKISGQRWYSDNSIENWGAFFGDRSSGGHNQSDSWVVPVVGFDASRVVPTASENRVKSRIVIFCNKIQ